MLDAIDYAWRIGGFLLVAGAVYGGIRRDLKAIHETALDARGLAERAHGRLDGHIHDHLQSRGL